ncbi:hypothetical protein Scep_004710 [Stephania cephalantha]|uniref:Uncharacterized protein n=1 Tax=Stephania cephalantha TaxID=152367 RepID=A0AAP0KSY1_9MAGN
MVLWLMDHLGFRTQHRLFDISNPIELGYEELVSFICNSLEIDNEKMILNMIYRYPVYIGTGTYNYVPLRIVDESTLKDAWEIAAEFPPPNCMDAHHVHHVHDSIIRDTLNRVITEDGSLSCPPILNEVGNDDFFDQEAAGIDDAPVGVGKFVVPSSVFMELSSEAIRHIH